ncbi:transposase [Chryseobacterium lathyri]|uniref:transposase n=1 Tax=Chryseobacterium lathyri TaxID=395933 RepID=UPI00358E0C22
MVNILKEYESGKATKDICREHGLSAATFYQWKQKYGGNMLNNFGASYYDGGKKPL